MRQAHPSANSPRCVCTTVKKASRAISRLYDAALAEVGMTVAQLAILRAIQRAGADGAALSRLAEELVMDRTSLYRSLTPLTDKGWVEIAEGPQGRTRHAWLTNAGRRSTESAGSHWHEVQTRMVEAIGSTRWQALQQDLAALAELGRRLGEHGAEERRGRSTAITTPTRNVREPR